MSNFNLNVKRVKNWWVVTSPEEKGLFLTNPSLNVILAEVPVALELLAKARYKYEKN